MDDTLFVEIPIAEIANLSDLKVLQTQARHNTRQLRTLQESQMAPGVAPEVRETMFREIQERHRRGGALRKRRDLVDVANRKDAEMKQGVTRTATRVVGLDAIDVRRVELMTMLGEYRDEVARVAGSLSGELYPTKVKLGGWVRNVSAAIEALKRVPELKGK